MEIIINKNDKVLVITPHQDDETIGCGGLLALYGPQTDVILLTDGKYEMSNYNIDSISSIRTKEFFKAMKIAKVSNIKCLNIPIGQINNDITIINDIDITKYKYIFIPNKHENHDDHNVVEKIIAKMKRKQKSEAIILGYEVWTPLRYVTSYLDISKVINKKIKMLEKYESQLSDRDYLTASIGLNSYRGMQNKTQYAEAYCDIRYNGILRIVYEKIPKSLKDIAYKFYNKLS